MSTVTKLQLQGAGTCSSGKQLVSEADTKDWCALLLDGSLDVVDGLGHHGWITWTVGDEETIVVLASKGWEIIVPRAYQNLNTAGDQASELVVLETDVQAEDTDIAA